MLSPIELGEVQAWSSALDIEEPKTIFYMMPLDSILKGKIFSRIFADSELNEKDGNVELAFDVQIDLIRYSLQKIDNFGVAKEYVIKTEKSKLGAVEYDVVSLDVIKKIPLEILPELAKFVTELSGISTEEKKS